MALIGIVGSRSLPLSSSSLISRTVSAIFDRQHYLAVGCCSGADRLALKAALLVAPGRLWVYSAFGPDGAGAGHHSAVGAVSQAGGVGAKVTYWAGGLQALPLRARLLRRSSRLVADVAASGGALIAFFEFPGSRGTLRSCRLAALAGVPVAAFPLGFPPAELPNLGPGSWHPRSHFLDLFLPAPAWLWNPPYTHHLPGLFDTSPRALPAGHLQCT